MVDDGGRGDEWLSLTQAARRLGWSRERLRGLIRRDYQRGEGRRYETMRGNGGELLVRLTPALTTAAGHPGRPDGPATLDDRGRPSRPAGDADDVADQRLAAVEADRDRWRQTAEERGMALARAEGEATALRDRVADLSRRLDRAEERLAQPWWKRLFG